MWGWRRTTPCERAAQWISLRLDAELSEVEAGALDRHLERCDACRSHSRELAVLTGLVRSAPLESPSVLISAPAPRRRRPRVTRRVALAGSLAAVASAVAATFTITGSSGGPSSTPVFSSPGQQLAFAYTKSESEPQFVSSTEGTLGTSIPASTWRAFR